MQYPAPERPASRPPPTHGVDQAMSTHSPFVGPRPFDTADQTIFHGRADETAALTKLWRDHRLTILHGQAGVGKTSLLRAGVLPRLGEDQGTEVLPVGRLTFPA